MLMDCSPVLRTTRTTLSLDSSAHHAVQGRSTHILSYSSSPQDCNVYYSTLSSLNFINLYLYTTSQKIYNIIIPQYCKTTVVMAT